jgi:hypothetical protein
MALAHPLRPFRRLAGALALTLAAACGDPNEIRASFETREATVTVYAISGTPAWAPAAITLLDAPAAVRLGPDFGFDVALEFDGAAAKLYPLQLVASDVVVAPGRRVGIQKLAGTTFDAITRAPNDGYGFTEPVTLAVGDVGVIESQNHPFCAGGFIFPYTIYAKFVVEAVDPATRSVRLKMRSDPNCGFRGLEDGLPSR